MSKTTNQKVILPLCGLYKTIKRIPMGSVSIEDGLLVYFHNHSDQGPPIILLPEKNVHNRWVFQEKGYLLEDKALTNNLKSLKPEGLYRLREHFHPNDEEIVGENALVQLGYTMKAEPIIFFPKPIKENNAFFFPDKGMKIPESIYKLLELIDPRGPFKPEKRHVH